jgi:tRNA(fMet)-specific endonuclease VapC
MNFFLDTSICIDVLRINGPYRSCELIEKIRTEHTGYISVISVAELSAGAYLSNRRDAVKKTEELLIHLKNVELSESIAFHGGKIFASLSKIGRKIEFNDCLIAATAQSLGFNEIVTRNGDHFNRIENFYAVVPEEISF